MLAVSSSSSRSVIVRRVVVVVTGRPICIPLQGRSVRQSSALSRRFATAAPPPPKTRPSYAVGDMNDEPATIAMDNTIRAKNAGLAVALLGFCIGVAVYSMSAVGQAGSSADDPLSALKQEAAAARGQQESEVQQTASTAALLQKFQAGDYDPDLQEQDELELQNAQEAAAAAKHKTAWWKFWARS